jgi:AraC-like DNA-binding protein
MNFAQEHVSHPHQSFRLLRLELGAFTGTRHRHQHLELTWIESGSGLRYVGDSVQPYEAGDLVLLGSNVPHAWVSRPRADGQTHKATVVQFAPGLLASSVLPEMAEARALCDEAGRGLLVDPAQGQAVTDALARLPAEPGLAGLGAFIAVLGELAGLRRAMTPLASRAARAVAASDTEKDRRIARVIEWIYAHLSRELRVTEAASLVRISPAAFSRYFSREVGRSFTEYVNDIRCSETCLRLRATDRPVAQIAGECGFETLSHFNQQFKLRYGVSPREFRRLRPP